MQMTVVRKLLSAMLSRSLRKQNLACAFRIHGHGECFTAGASQESVPQCVIVFDGVSAFCLFAVSPCLMTFAKLFVEGHITGEGDWFALAHFVNKLNDKVPPIFERVVQHFARPQKIDVHYGWSADAFACFLDDPYMQYTCGRLSGTETTLEEAQLNKLKLIAEWLGVQTGTRHLDVGCGWGGLIRYFTERHDTLSDGVTLSPQQAAYAREHTPSQSATFCVTRFEDFAPTKSYDCISVVGMLEHVPVAKHPEFFQRLTLHLRTGGRVYLQCITRSPTRRAGARTRFLNHYVFAHELNTLENLQKLAFEAGFEVVKVEEGHMDYAFTTRQWVERILARKTEIEQLLGDNKVYRILLGYLTMGSLSFADRQSNLHRLLLVKR